ncbi:MAG: hypothetical protein IPG24_02490 [Leptospiraceae bacterium]|nr:hypothetical protein [Leptospiraceae bacterium]
MLNFKHIATFLLLLIFIFECKRSGTINLPDGGSYKGIISNGKPNVPDGRKYTGEWKTNRQNGKGILTNANGDSYNGHFKDDLPDGEGIHSKADGSILFKGQWLQGKPVK